MSQLGHFPMKGPAFPLISMYKEGKFKKNTYKGREGQATKANYNSLPFIQLFFGGLEPSTF